MITIRLDSYGIFSVFLPLSKEQVEVMREKLNQVANLWDKDELGDWYNYQIRNGRRWFDIGLGTCEYETIHGYGLLVIGGCSDPEDLDYTKVPTELSLSDRLEVAKLIRSVL